MTPRLLTFIIGIALVLWPSIEVLLAYRGEDPDEALTDWIRHQPLSRLIALSCNVWFGVLLVMISAVPE